MFRFIDGLKKREVTESVIPTAKEMNFSKKIS